MKSKHWSLIWTYSKKITPLGQDHIVYDNCLPVLFRTRKEARAYANKRYGYIKERKDLRGWPHGWRFPKSVRITVSYDKDC